MAMNCSCRTTALKIFVRSIAEFQLPAARTASQRCSRQFLYRAATTPLAPHIPTGIPSAALYRGFGTTPSRRKENDDNILFDAPPPPKEESTRPRSPRSPRPKPRAEPKKTKKNQDANATPADTSEKQPETRKKESWQVQKASLKAKFPEGWNPRKRLSPDALAGIRALHQQFPGEYSTEVLATRFEVSPEAIRRILKSKWTPSTEEEIDRQERWFNRGKQVWERWAALGKKPPRRWRQEGITRDPSWNEKGGRRRLASAQRKLARNLL